jgi:hypothetical protein
MEMSMKVNGCKIKLTVEGDIFIVMVHPMKGIGLKINNTVSV